ncbi:MAG: deoxyribonuclease IV [Candidatus Dadabacteria bacterium]|nr:MAG: deoxyribonuclease IV [Candidatus Dadabacteria bacterium]
MERFLGAHVSVAGGLEKSLERAEELGINTIQVHPSAPQRWNSKPFEKEYWQKFKERIKKSPVKKVFFHAIYLINLANPDKQKFHLSKLSLVHYLNLLAEIKGDGVIVHVGSLKDQESEEKGYQQIIKGINWVLKESNPSSKLLLEMAAGSGKVVGSRAEELRKIYQGVDNKKRVGFALDTQHIWASGYDIAGDLEGVIKDIKKNFNGNIGAVHINDSKTELGSKKDRHENIGKGKIGEKALRDFINHPYIRRTPCILETPALKSMDTAKAEVKKLLSLAK